MYILIIFAPLNHLHMKNLLFILLLLPISLFAQQLPTDSTTGKFMVVGNVAVPGTSQKDLHDKTLLWLTTTYKAPQSSIQQDKEDKIELKGFKKIKVKTDDTDTTYPLYFLLTVSFKDGAYDYKATNFSADNINYYTNNSLKHPDQLKFKNRKDKEAYTTVYNSTIEAIRKVGTDLQTGVKKNLIAKTTKK